jgi:hypothetical protein
MTGITAEERTSMLVEPPAHPGYNISLADGLRQLAMYLTFSYTCSIQCMF